MPVIAPSKKKSETAEYHYDAADGVDPEVLGWRAEALKAAAWAYPNLSYIERDILAYLASRPIKTWCKGCDAALHKLAERIHGNA